VSPFANIPLFPLNIFLLPEEKVSLHIFENRYKQLLADTEANQTGFGIYFAHGTNKQKVGSYVRLEKVLKRYPTGEADILVTCDSLFTLSRYSEYFHGKLYSGGAILPYALPSDSLASTELSTLFRAFLSGKNLPNEFSTPGIYSIASEMNLDIQDKLKFIQLKSQFKQEAFLKSRIRFMKFVKELEESSSHTFHLN
jgi:uncharacterized protein